jgi:undecaprenyl diphosphate synthase
MCGLFFLERESTVAKRSGQAAVRDAKAQSELKKRGEIPRHIAVIMDGNGRWAQRRGMPRIAGHREGVESVRDVVETCGQLGVGYLTLYAFSTENWKRPREEVSLLMRLLVKALHDETDRLHRNNVRLRTIGDTDALPEEVRTGLQASIRKTQDNTGLTLVLALSYSGRWDLCQAVTAAVNEARAGTLPEGEVTEQMIAERLSTRGIPDPDLLIRSSGEFRISNFLLWQLAYAEMYITPVCWPSFRREHLYEAIRDYQNRERRFGLVSGQLETAGKPKRRGISRMLRSVTGT